MARVITRKRKNSSAKSRSKRSKSSHRGSSPNLILLILFLGMILFGLFMVFDASYFLKGWDRFVKQLVWVGIAIPFALPLYFIDYKKLKFFAVPLFVITIVFLFISLFMGVSLNGSTRWIILIPGYVQFQPGEVAKFAVVLFLASWLSRNRKKYKNVSQLFEYRAVEILVFFIGLGVTSLLIVLSRDLGNAMIVAAISLSVFFISGTDLIHTLGTFVVILMSGGLGALAAFIEPYRLKRIQTFIDLLLKGQITDPRGAGYQISQILIGIGGSGGLHGTGFGRSRQRLGYLVEDTAFTDSIGAVILEELGFYKGLAFVLIYSFMLYICFRIALQAKDRFGQLLAGGMSIWLALQFCLHMAANLGLMPLTGVTLPFISYGGSSVIMTISAMAVILNVSRSTQSSK